jgi:hypothetical protein
LPATPVAGKPVLLVAAPPQGRLAVTHAAAAGLPEDAASFALMSEEARARNAGIELVPSHGRRLRIRLPLKPLEPESLNHEDLKLKSSWSLRFSFCGLLL